MSPTAPAGIGLEGQPFFPLPSEDGSPQKGFSVETMHRQRPPPSREAKDCHDEAVKTIYNISITIIINDEAQKLSTAMSSSKTVCMGDVSYWNRYGRGTCMCCTLKTGGTSRNSWLMRKISTSRPRGRQASGYFLASHL